jgi:hypothetical protein
VKNAKRELPREQKNVKKQEISGCTVQQNPKMTFDIFLKGSALGIISGLILGLILKMIEGLTNQKVYTLLLNIDFIPLLGAIKWPETVEFIFHLIVSWFLGLIFYYLSERWRYEYKQRWLLSAILSFPAILMYFPLSTLAIKEVPDATNMEAFLYWFVAHLLFMLSMVHLYPFLKDKNLIPK